MRMNITIDDELYKSALRHIDPKIPESALLEVALRTFVLHEATRRVIALGGTAPDIEDIPRSRYDWDDEEEDDDENNRNH